MHSSETTMWETIQKTSFTIFIVSFFVLMGIFFFFFGTPALLLPTAIITSIWSITTSLELIAKFKLEKPTRDIVATSLFLFISVVIATMQWTVFLCGCG